MTAGIDIGDKALDLVEAKWRDRGYSVVRRPGLDQLPEFLDGFQPDAIATGPQPSLVIEILQPLGASSETRIRRLQALLHGRTDWRLEAIYVPPPPQLFRVSRLADIAGAAGRAERLSTTDPDAALMLGWAALEAATRLAEPVLSKDALSPLALVDVLIANGHLPQEEAAFLREVGQRRHAVAHGQLDPAVDAAEVRRLVKLTEDVLGQGIAA